MSEHATVLVVDDELGPRESARAVLKNDYRVLLADEGEKALHIIEQEAVDIILLDLRMPGISGMQLMNRIKQLDSSIEVIVVTGYASYDTVLEGLRLHAFDYIPKPFNVPHLRETVKRALAHRQQHQTQRAAAEKPLFAPQPQQFSHTLYASLHTIEDCGHKLQHSTSPLDMGSQNALERLQTASQKLRQVADQYLGPQTQQAV